MPSFSNPLPSFCDLELCPRCAESNICLCKACLPAALPIIFIEVIQDLNLPSTELSKVVGFLYPCPICQFIQISPASGFSASTSCLSKLSPSIFVQIRIQCKKGVGAGPDYPFGAVGTCLGIPKLLSLCRVMTRPALQTRPWRRFSMEQASCSIKKYLLFPYTLA